LIYIFKGGIFTFEMCYIARHESTRHSNSRNHVNTKQNMGERNLIC